MPKETHKGFTLSPYQILDKKTGEILDLNAEINKVEKTLHNLQALVLQDIEHSQELLDNVDEYKSQKPAKAGEYLGLNIDKETLKIINPGKSGASRLERIYRGEVVSYLRSWKNRIDTTNRTSKTFVSQGYKRTVKDTKPDVSLSMNLGYSDSGYWYWDKPNVLAMVIAGQWRLLFFNIPIRYLDSVDKISAPIIRKDKNTGRIVFNFSAINKYQQSKLSRNYIVGVDVGKKQYATVGIYSVKHKKIVRSSTLSLRVNELWHSIQTTEEQIKKLYKKVDQYVQRFDTERVYKAQQEIVQQRAKNVGKKLELAVLAGQEIAELAHIYDNAVVSVEDLSWVQNTMQNGKWNRGELVKWIKHYVEQNGSLMFKVNAKNTSQACYVCDQQIVHRKRDVYCKACFTILDRDVNAAGNIAKRAVSPLLKTVQTRSKNKNFTSKKSIKKSPKSRESLRYPGESYRKNKSTPKQVKQKKNSYKLDKEVCSKLYPVLQESIVNTVPTSMIGSLKDGKILINKYNFINKKSTVL